MQSLSFFYSYKIPFIIGLCNLKYILFEFLKENNGYPKDRSIKISVIPICIFRFFFFFQKHNDAVPLDRVVIVSLQVMSQLILFVTFLYNLGHLRTFFPVGHFECKNLPHIRVTLTCFGTCRECGPDCSNHVLE